MSPREEQIRSLLCEEAVEWFVAHREELDVERREQFARWLQASPQHVEEYLGIVLTERDLRRAVAGKAGEPGRAVHGFERRRRAPVLRWRYAMAAAAGIVVASGLWMYQRIAPTPAVGPVQLATQHGEQLSERLADGSVLHLNTDTAVSIDFREGARRIDLRAGQAMFEVAHDPRRPFTVYAQSLVVTAVGTKFDVYQREDSLVVTVVAGTISVAPMGAAGGGAAALHTRRYWQRANNCALGAASGQVRAVASTRSERPRGCDGRLSSRTNPWASWRWNSAAMPRRPLSSRIPRCVRFQSVEPLLRTTLQPSSPSCAASTACGWTSGPRAPACGTGNLRGACLLERRRGAVPGHHGARGSVAFPAA